ncbi:MAG: UDP-glucose--hexose-1-phosphate uridylyltransferase [Clostridia bacterium]|nr:UDP-glucose--hexose-1-phosphate uridylyltransferase [Clostridia bacterium]
MTDGKILTEKLLRYAEAFLHLNKRDEIYFRNILLREFNEDSPAEKENLPDLSYIDSLDVPDEIVKEVEEIGLKLSKAEEGFENLYSTYIFGILSPLPSKVNETFRKIKEEEGIEKACEYFYNLSVKNNYVQKTAIGKNLKWEYEDGSKTLEITVNLSKPEKNNKDIAKLLSAPKSVKYPACLLCKENEGFKGTATHPARENIRTISLSMGGEPWFVQYSPYAYYNEHMIAISESHVPMHIKADTIDKVLDFVDFFPNYMIGSNAALPIVGGSILNHEHFQGGGHIMPMHKAPVKKYYECKDFPDLKVGVVDWYNSVIRFEGTNRASVKALAARIIENWEKFTDKDCYIFAETDGVPHNSLSPVVRKENGKYIMDMILRNNITNDEYPEGVFHAHPEYHNIKKEGIGLIEAMGLFILPGRLKKQLAEIADILCKKTPYNFDELNKEDNYLYAHRFMIKTLVEEGFANTFEDAEKRVKTKVNEACRDILYNTAVFKNDEVGKRGFEKFLKLNGIE